MAQEKNLVGNEFDADSSSWDEKGFFFFF